MRARSARKVDSATMHPNGPAGIGRNEPAAGATDDTLGQEAPQASVTRASANGATLSLSFDGSTTAADQTTPIIATGVEFDPTVGAARFPPGTQLAYPDRGGVDPNQGSIAFWVRMESDPSLMTDGRLLAQLRTATWENRLEINIGPRFIGLLLTNSDGIEQGASFPAMNWAPGAWHQVTTTWGDAIMQLYVDGNLVDQEEYTGSLVLPPDTPLYVASQRNVPTAKELQGRPTVSLRAWTVFPRILDPDELTALMVQSAPPT